MLGENRVIVSDVPGTTRDAIDTPFERDGQRYMLIDTAGIRRKRAIEDASIERYSVIRSFAAVRRADVVLFVCDATEGLSEQDVKIAGYVHEEGKPSIILVNKWTLSKRIRIRSRRSRRT
jgi:GTP-binding protein